MRAKITVVGAGNVGATVAQRLSEKGGYDVCLVDIIDGVPQGKALDLSQAGPICGYESFVNGTTTFEGTELSSVVVITSGVPRKPGMSRDELLSTNAKIIRSVVQEIARRSPDAVLIMVTNPLDAMAHVAQTISRFPRERVIGMAGVLDSARFCTFIAEELKVSRDNVQAMVLGGHGDTMVPLIRYTTVAGRPISEWLPKERIEALVRRTRDGGAEIVNLLKSGSAYYAPSAAVVDMVEAILKDQKKILPCAVRCDGEYGIRGLFVGVPTKLGRRGAEAIIEYELTTEERAALMTSAAAVQELSDAVDRLLGKSSKVE
jgi:malate dehydrogenase